MALNSNTAKWSKADYQSATASDIKGLSFAQVAALQHPDWLSPAAFGGFSAAQIPAISINWYYMNAAQLNALSPAAFAAIPTTAIGQLTSATLSGLGAAQITDMSLAQIAALGHADHLSTAAVASLNASQIAAITTSFYWMSAAWLNATQASAFAGLTASEMSALTAAAIGGLDAAHIAALTTRQIAALTTSQIRALSASQISALSIADIAALTSSQLAALSAAQISGLTAAQAAALSVARIAGLSSAQIGGLSADAVSGLSVAQIVALGLHIAGLSTAAIAGLSTSTLAQLSGWELADLTMAQTAALTSAQIGALSAKQVSYLSEGQLQALGTHLQALSIGALAGLGTASILEIYTDLSAAQLASLSASQAAAVKLAETRNASLMSSLSSSGLLSQVSAVLASGQSLYSYQGLLRVLTGLEGSIGANGLVAAQFADLKTLTAAVGAVEGTGSYLFGVLNALVNGNAFNDTWTGGATTSVALGNLAAGASATQFQALVGKWFLGADLSSWSSATTYTAQPGPLFGLSGASMNDPAQGGIGDCYFIAAMVETAEFQPGLIDSMFTDNGNGTYGVRLYDIAGSTHYFTVDNEVPGGYVAHTPSGAEWVSLLEKAFVEYDSQMYGAANAYDSISGGLSKGLTAITGKTVSGYYCGSVGSQQTWDTSIKAKAVAALANGEEVMYCSFRSDSDAINGKTDLVSSHMFAVTGYDQATGDFILQNPWGVSGGSGWNGVFEHSMDDLWGGTSGSGASCGILIANGASPVGSALAPYTAATPTHATLLG